MILVVTINSERVFLYMCCLVSLRKCCCTAPFPAFKKASANLIKTKHYLWAFRKTELPFLDCIMNSLWKYLQLSLVVFGEHCAVLSTHGIALRKAQPRRDLVGWMAFDWLLGSRPVKKLRCHLRKRCGSICIAGNIGASWLMETIWCKLYSFICTSVNIY